MSGEKTRYHAEVKVTIEGRDARVNCFADTLNEIFLDIGTIVAQFPPDWKSPAKRDIANAETIAKQAPPHASIPVSSIPDCNNCGKNQFMELIGFTDKKTGQPRKAWKCQECKEWHWENGKGQ